MEAYAYGQFLVNLMNGTINWASDSIMVMLCTSSYVPDQENHEFKSDIDTLVVEVDGTNYVAGGVVLANAAVAYSELEGKVLVQADPAAWSEATITARYAIIYDGTPASPGAQPLIGFLNFGEDKASTSGTFKISFPDGVMIFSIPQPAAS
jgi:hypothetical protein